MTIDKNKLIDLLVEKTSMNRNEVEAQLDQLIERILDAAKRGKALEIKGFGVFYFDEEGELRFDASDELSTEISFKYAGMKPVELKPERDTSIPEDIEEDEDDDLEEARVSKMEEDEEDLFVDPFEEPDTDEPEESKTVSETDDIEEEEESPFDFDDEEDADAEEADEDFISDPFSEEALEPLEESTEEKEEKTTKLEDIKPVSRRPVKRKDNTGIFILIAIVVITALIGAYFFYISPTPQSSAESNQSSAQMESESESDDAGSDETNVRNSQATGQQPSQSQETNSTEQAGANQGTEEGIESENGASTSQTNQELYGLMGPVVETANSGYSIVVHSFRNEENAREAANQLRTDGGYRVIVNSRTVYDNQVWRVSVGQFETLGDAQQATTRLPDPYSTQNFIQRIRTN